jgi:putative hemolysin
VLFILALILLNGVFAGAEIAVVSLRSSRLDALASGGNTKAVSVLRLRDNPERFLATVQIGATIVSAIASVFGGHTIAARIAALLHEIPALDRYADSIGLALVVALVSFLTLVVGELVPKSLALRNAERYALFIGGALLGLSWIARPAVWFLTASSNLILRFFGDHTTFTEARLSPEELQQLVEEATKTGQVNPNAGEIASRAFDFAGLSIAKVMVPRNRVIAIPRRASLDEVRALVLEKGHTRMPVFDGDLDNLTGYINVKDLIAVSWERPLFILEDIIRPAYFVVQTMRAVDLLEEMKLRRVQFAVVVDELGVTAGIVTLEDLIEELVGEIASEHDEAAPPMTRAEPDGAFLVRGEAAVRDVNRELDLELPEEEGWSTVAGLCLELAGRIPKAGEVLRVADGTTLEIADATDRQVLTVRVRKPKDPADGEKEGEGG